MVQMVPPPAPLCRVQDPAHGLRLVALPSRAPASPRAKLEGLFGILALETQAAVTSTGAT